MQPIVIPQGDLTHLRTVIFRTDIGDAPALLLRIEKGEHAILLAFDRAAQLPAVEQPKIRAPGQGPAMEVVVMGRIVANVPHGSPEAGAPCWYVPPDPTG